MITACIVLLTLLTAFWTVIFVLFALRLLRVEIRLPYPRDDRYTE